MEFPKKLLVVGDRVLINPEDGDDRTRVGLYLPATAIDSMQVQTGLIVATGPGTPVADLSSLDEEPWKTTQREGPGRGMQARVGDHAIFWPIFKEKSRTSSYPGTEGASHMSVATFMTTLLPDFLSVKIFWQPASFNARSCRSRFWSRVETRP